MIETVDDVLMALICLMRALDDEQRLEVVWRLREEFCLHCGSKYLPCMCLRDD